MTKSEANRLRRLELENADLRSEMAKHLRIYGETLGELVTLRATVQLMRETLDSDPYEVKA